MTETNGHDKSRHAIRIHAGQKAKALGKSFESHFENACLVRGVTCTRIPDGCQQVGAKKIVRVHTPFDYILSSQGRAAFIDTKAISQRTFPASLIKDHQALELFNHEMQGIAAGYVIHFIPLNQTVYVPGSRLIDAVKDRKAIGPESQQVVSLGDIIRLNPIKIFHSAPQIIKRNKVFGLE